MKNRVIIIVKNEEIFKQLAEIKKMLLTLQNEMKELRFLVEDQEEVQTEEESKLVDEANKAVKNGTLDNFVKLDEL
ncbi:MAG: hypothetical protein ACTSRU_17670 [Candidatus Hodarchaeales archaeon]